MQEEAGRLRSEVVVGKAMHLRTVFFLRPVRPLAVAEVSSSPLEGRWLHSIRRQVSTCARRDVSYSVAVSSCLGVMA